MGRELKDRAETQYNDWQGTVALEESQDASINQLLGISDDYHVLRFELYRELGGHGWAYAVRREDLENTSLPELAAGNGGKVPVTELEIGSVDVPAVIGALDRFHMLVDESHGVKHPIDITNTEYVGSKDG